MSLVLRNISHRFGDVEAVSDASIEVARGEIACLFGPSGCGKTTLLRIAAGLERLQQGEVILNGARLAAPALHAPPERRSIGFVFQDYVLFPHLSAHENVRFGARNGNRQTKARIAALLDAFRLGALGRRYPHELSGGQQQRVALARALAREPHALLLDEPFASIDAALRHQLREELRLRLKEQEVAVLLVTHDPDEALTLGDRIALMRDGAIIEKAAPEALYRAPQTPDGAMIFRGGQSFEGTVRNGRMQTPLGAVDALNTPEGRGVLILREGALSAAENHGGPARVVAARFAGPGWSVFLRLDGLEAPVRVVMENAPTLGQRCTLSIDPSKAFVFSYQ